MDTEKITPAELTIDNVTTDLVGLNLSGDANDSTQLTAPTPVSSPNTQSSEHQHEPKHEPEQGSVDEPKQEPEQVHQHVDEHEHQHEGEGDCDCGHDHGHDHGHSHENPPQSKVDQMIESGKKSQNKSYKKLMKKVQKDPKLQELITYFQQNPNIQPTQQGPMTNRDRLRAKIEQQRLRRGGRAVQQAHREKQQEQAKRRPVPEKKTEEQKAAELQNNVQSKVVQSIEEIKKQKRAQRNRLRKLQKKYGQVTFDRYSEALRILNDPSVTTADDINREKNIVDLYIKQNPNATEKHLDVEIIDEDLSDGDMEDIDEIDESDEMEDLSS